MVTAARIVVTIVTVNQLGCATWKWSLDARENGSRAWHRKADGTTIIGREDALAKATEYLRHLVEISI
jgi:hypothetical protein